MTNETIKPLRQSEISTIVQRIVKAVNPERILLFGSYAKGSVGPNSDIDILVIMPDGTHRRRTAQKLYLALSGIGRAKDIVVVTNSDILTYGNSPSLVLRAALQDGKELYRAAA